MQNSCGHTRGSTPEERYEAATCALFSNGTCRSCSLLGIDRGERLAAKLSRIATLLAGCGMPLPEVEPIVIPENPWGSRRKVKMTVSGTVESPVIGITRADQSCVELARCPLSPDPIRSLLETLRSLITKAHLTPYDIQGRRGELKAIIIMSDQSLSAGIVRFVLRSSEAIPRIRKITSELQDEHGWVKVVSCNIQPLPAAILEGREEILLTKTACITAHYGALPLTLSPRSFMQVTPEIGGALYDRAALWCRGRNLGSVLDLFCGVGGFSMALAPHARAVTGVEISSDAVGNAQKTAQILGLTQVKFVSGDVDSILGSLGAARFETIVVNPPRRGLSGSIRSWVVNQCPAAILYSSCNPETFARDVADWSKDYSMERLALFDMFPLTEHCEVLGFLKRKETA